MKSVTVRLVVAANVVLTVGWEFDAESDAPFESVSSAKMTLPMIASEASVIASRRSMIAPRASAEFI